MNGVHFSSKTDLWSTPQDFFDELNEKYNFTLDPCATKDNAKCKKFFTKEKRQMLSNIVIERQRE